MASKGSLLCLLALLIVIAAVESWSGNYCTRRVCRYRPRRVCRYRLWFFGCCAWKTVWEGYWATEYFCCPGYRHNGRDQNCNIPVCTPPCQNNGNCTDPGVCKCPSTHTGFRCASATCSYNAPCFPGTCFGTDSCDCDSGFSTDPPGTKADYCLKIDGTPQPDLRMTEMQVRLSYMKRNMTPPMEVHWLMADSTELADTDTYYTNRRSFNRLETKATSQYFPPPLPDHPPYVNQSQFGIVDGQIEVWLMKLPAGGSTTPFVSLNATYDCLKRVSSTKPESNVYNCSIFEPNFDRVLEHGDTLKITFMSKGGGYRQLKNPDNNQIIKNQTFDPVTGELSVEFRFDYYLPYHCLEKSTCAGSESMLKVPDITKNNPITIEWDGWTDDNSGMFRYAWEVFPMRGLITSRTNEKSLEINPSLVLSPLVNTEVMHATYAPQSFTLPRPGMYSVILEAADWANNTKFTRRLVLYDPDPQVTLDPQNDLYVLTASPAANYKFQNDINNPIIVTWDQHFRNAFHEENLLLEKVRRYPVELEDGTTVAGAKRFWKVIEPTNVHQEDHEGARTVDAIPNERGIVKFSIQTAQDADGGRNQPPVPQGGTWTDVGLNTSYTVPKPSKTETVTVWVRAEDVMGTQRVDRTQVSFDSSPPEEIDGIQFNMNKRVEGIDFSSQFTVQTKDSQSGIAYILWNFTRVSTNTVIYHELVHGIRVQSCSDFTKCHCTATGDCFSFTQTFSVSNCKMIVEKDTLKTERINVTADITNMAGLTRRLSMLKEDLTELNGTEAYFPPQNITVTDITTDSVTLTWSFPPSCFLRTALWVVVNGEKRAVHKDAQVFAVTGLSDDTEYTLQMITDYEGEVQSDPASVKFVTVEAEGLGVGAIIGIIIVEAEGLGVGAIIGIIIGVLILLLLLALILMFVLWRKGKIFQKEGTTANRQMHRVSRAFDNVRKTIRLRGGESGGAAFHNNAYKADGPGGDDIYLYGSMAFGSRQNWQLDDNNLTLMEQVAEGRFATIYKAIIRQAGGNQQTVAAKMLKAGFSEDDALKMMAKINFMATQLENHPNVIRFVGAITDNAGWGPVLVMEFCEMGQMDKWLVQHKANMNEQVMENLFQFAVGITKGMEYLASKKITHKRLAARNVLLNFLLEPKVAGFGPQRKEGDEDKATRVPAKWAAPEVLQEKPATEKSDVWSYGVVLWEIFSMGEVPYPGIHAAEIGTHLKSGYRMDKPELADGTFFDLMNECWQYKQSKRPTFATIRARLDKLLSTGNRQTVDFYYDTKDLNG